MIQIFVLLGLSVGLAYLSEKKTNTIRESGETYSVLRDPAYLALLAALILFTGLRTSYNDTWNYVSGYENTRGLSSFLGDPAKWNIFKNPLFAFYNSLLRSLKADSQVLIFTTSALTQISFLWLFKRYSQSFTFSVFIYITLGTFLVSMAAMKQMCAMSVAAFAFPSLEKKQWVRYYVLIFVAMLLHTYALIFAVLPLFKTKPWSWFTFLFVAAVVFVMMNFEETITSFMEQANEVGKTLEEYEVFDDHGVNGMRVAVYAVVPLLSLIFRKWVFHEAEPMDHILVHMSIISLAFMVMGTQSGANMFARMAHYFELGTICCLPRLLKQTFDERSNRLTTAVAVLCFLGFFAYAIVFSGDFANDYKSLLW